MTGFLANLAGLALGQPPAGTARLSLPPRFSGGARTEIDSGLEQVEMKPARQENQPSSLEPSVREEVQRQLPVGPLVEIAPAPASPSREEPASRTPLPTTRQTARPLTVERAVSDRPWPLPPHPIEQTEVVRSVIQTVTQAQPKSPIRTEKIVMHVSDDRAPSHTAPLSQAALANRATIEREPPPVVNVIIDRIDVRAARETPQSQTPRRAKPQPSLSLADYLGARR